MVGSKDRGLEARGAMGTGIRYRLKNRGRQAQVVFIMRILSRIKCTINQWEKPYPGEVGDLGGGCTGEVVGVTWVTPGGSSQEA